jgi:hypothetical protein
MSFGAVAGAVVGGVASSAVGSVLGSGNSGAASAAAAADPFASQRAQYQDQLSKLVSDPSSITSTPGYQFQLQQGLNAVNGQMASSGYLNSGNRLSALNQEGQNFASTQLQNQELFLAQLAGANIGSPSAAGSILQNQNTANQSAAGAVSSQIGSAVTSGFNNLFGSSGSNTGYTFTGGGGSSNAYNFNSGVSDPSYGVSYGFGV